MITAAESNPIVAPAAMILLIGVPTTMLSITYFENLFVVMLYLYFVTDGATVMIPSNTRSIMKSSVSSSWKNISTS